MISKINNHREHITQDVFKTFIIRGIKSEALRNTYERKANYEETKCLSS